MLLTIFVVFLIAAYFFAFAESSTIAAERVMLHHAAREGNPRAKLVEAFRENPRRFFGTTLIGTNICIVTLSAVGAHEMLPNWGIHIVAATAIVDIVILVVAEITPKTLSLSNPTLNSMRIAGMLEVTARALAPAVWLLTWLPSKIINLDRLFETGDRELITESQLVHMIGRSAREGSIERKESERAVNVFKFGNTAVDKVMIPRADVVHLSVGDSVRQALETANLTGYSRIPVLTSDGNDSPGFIAAKDVLRLYREGRVEEPVDNHLRPITFVPETKRILELLDEFRKGRRQIALVIDEFGSMVGVVTLEDLLEEILGEIYDEYDTDAAEAKWDKGMFVIPGSFPVAKLAQGLKARLPEGEFDTAAGLFLHLLGRIPTPGEAVALDNGWELVATHLAGHRITRLLARRTGPPGVTG